MIIYFGGVRGILKQFINNDEEIIWVITQKDFCKNDNTYRVKRIFILDMHNVDLCSELILNYISSFEDILAKDIHCYSFHDNYHDLCKQFAELNSYKTNIVTDANYITKNKNLTRKCWNQLFNIDGLAKILTKDTIDEICFDGTKYIAKPISGTGSKNVFIIDKAEQASSIINAGIQYVIEDFYDGQEYSIECLSYNGAHKILMIAEKQLFDNSFVEKSHLVGKKFSDDFILSITLKLFHFLDYIQIFNGISHIEVKVFNDKVQLIEIQIRMGGDYLYEAYDYITGESLAELSYRVVSEPNFSIKSVRDTLSSDSLVYIEFFHWVLSGAVFVKWANLEFYHFISGILGVNEINKSFEKILYCSDDRNLAVIVSGKSLAEIKNILSKFKKTIYPIFKGVQSEER